MTQSEIARAMGVSQPSVHGWVSRGCPTDSIEAVRAWCDANLQFRRRKGVRPTPTPGGALPSSEAFSARSAVADSLMAARLQREQADAEVASLKAAELRGELVRAADVRHAYGRRVAATRDALLQVPARLAGVLAAETDQATVHRLLDAELHALLVNLSEV